MVGAELVQLVVEAGPECRSRAAELYGIVGQTRPGASDEQIVRDTFVRDALLSLASGDIGALWKPVTTVPTAKGIGDLPYDATAHAEEVLETFSGINRP